MEMTMDKLIRRYGSSMLLVQDGKETAIRAFLQESASRSKGSAQWEMSELGAVDQGVYVYIGPATPEARPGDVVRFHGKKYQLRRAQPVWVEDRVLYCWGICVEMGVERVWGE